MKIPDFFKQRAIYRVLEIQQEIANINNSPRNQARDRTEMPTEGWLFRETNMSFS